MTPSEYLREIGAEPSFIRWADTYARLKDVWERCDRSDWMLYLLEHSGQPSERGLREFAFTLVRRYQDWMASAECRAVLRAMDSSAFGPATFGSAEMTSIREVTRRAAEQAQSVGNWVAARSILILWSACLEDPMEAAKVTAEQAGMAAQYVEDPPGAMDWANEMARQADDLRQALGNPFAHLT